MRPKTWNNDFLENDLNPTWLLFIHKDYFRITFVWDLICKGKVKVRNSSKGWGEFFNILLDIKVYQN